MTTQPARGDLPRSQPLLALAWSCHRRHSTACRYWEEQAADTVVFTTLTALWVVRVVSQPRAMGEAGAQPGNASAVQAAFLLQPGVRLVDDAAASC